MTSALNMAALRDLFARLQKKDPGASQEVQALGKGMSDMGDSGDAGDYGTSQRPPTIGIHNDSSDDIPLPEVGLATHLSGRYGEESQAPEQTGAPQAGGSPATDSSSSSSSSGGGGHDWGTLLRMAGSGFSSLGHNFGNSNPAEEGSINKMGVERLRADQMNALKQRHSMWDTAYKHSQELPPEVLSDPRFATLATAKAALDKDMLDGKIDNEKNVSLLLTELARHKDELDQVSQNSKVKQQIAGETQLLQGREAAGLVEPKDYNFEGTPVTRTEYLAASKMREKEKQDLEQDKLRWETQARWHKEQMDASSADRQALMDSRADQQHYQNITHAIDASAQQYAEQDENGNYRVTPKSMAKARAEHSQSIIREAKRRGVQVLMPGEGPRLNRNSWLIDGQEYPAEATDQVLQHLQGG
jgi:hypothetical protein